MLSKILQHPNLNMISDDIYEIENFLPKELLENLLGKIANSKEEDWTGSKKVLLDSSTKTYSSQWHKAMLKLDQDEDNNLLCELVNNVFSGSHNFKKFDFIRRIQLGGKLEEHYDAQNDRSVEAGLIIYLNDNYDGGELYYKYKDLTHKPKANSLLIHSGKKECTHEVNEVTGGIRYFMTHFASLGTKTNV